ncbi:MAG: hypothetical protein GW808_14615 [Sphingomonadales bacterium]|nr:hypothetical protein [Sphingomonadales bacterium]NCO47474.1 hypothetical protein [Sphingomonadales bacterium]NCO98974.1 hypothetical protein [Sphingomonadales bacterium]NCP26283.1 hypothetical protein [Sphingomonadales bacterium]NCP44657.1 hypothetical protein [Sphingomonadales bacterium]
MAKKVNKGPVIIEGRCSVVQRGSTGSPPTETSSPSPAKKTRKPRRDGWTEERRKIFIAVLRESGCVLDACRVAGMSDTSAYRLRERDPEIAEQWDDAVANGQRGLVAVAHQHAVVGKETVIYRNGEEVERRVVPSDSILALLIKRGDLGGRIGARTADKVITWEEWQDGLRFDDEGNKVSQHEEMLAVRASLEAKLGDMRTKLLARRAREQEQQDERLRAAEERIRAAEARAAELEAKNGLG